MVSASYHARAPVVERGSRKVPVPEQRSNSFVGGAVLASQQPLQKWQIPQALPQLAGHRALSHAQQWPVIYRSFTIDILRERPAFASNPLIMFPRWRRTEKTEKTRRKRKRKLLPKTSMPFLEKNFLRRKPNLQFSPEEIHSSRASKHSTSENFGADL